MGALFLWMIVPLAMTIYFSFIRYSLLNPDISGFAGFENYQYLAEDESFWPSIINTVILVGSVLIITIVFGTLLAVLYDREFFGKNVATLLVIAPFFVMPTVSALIWKNFIMHPDYGLIAFVLQKIGLHPIAWFTRLSTAFHYHYRRLGMAPLRFSDPVHFAEVVGCRTEGSSRQSMGPTRFQLFFHIIVPHLQRAIGVVVMIETIFLLSIFAEIYTTTSGGPGHASENLAFLVYSLGIQGFNVGTGSAGGILAVILANIVAYFLVKMLAKNLKGR